MRGRGKCVVAIGSLWCLASGVAHGQSGRTGAAVPGDDEPPPPEVAVGALDRVGVDLGAHVGVALPFGDLVHGIQISDGLSGLIPLGLELGIRANKNVAVGLGIEMAPARTKGCSAYVSCSATDYRFSLEAIFTARAVEPMNPWVGLGVGYEWLELSAGTNVEIRGWDYANIEVGGEFRPGDQGGLGPFVGLSLGEYTSGSVGGMSGNLTNPAIHAWLQLGLRGVINL